METDSYPSMVAGRKQRSWARTKSGYHLPGPPTAVNLGATTEPQKVPQPPEIALPTEDQVFEPLSLGDGGSGG